MALPRIHINVQILWGLGNCFILTFLNTQTFKISIRNESILL